MVWLAGTRITAYADAVASRTGWGQAAVGAILLGGVTSLPEVATVVAAAGGGDAALAVNNLLGGVALQVAILALADAVIGRDALTSIVAGPGVLLQGALGVLLLAVVAAGIAVGDVGVLGLGAWSSAVAAGYLGSVVLITRSRAQRAWLPALGPGPGPEAPEGRDEGRRSHAARLPTPKLAARTVLVGVAILLAGYALTRSGEAIAEQTGLGTSFVGAVLVALATSLPEVSTTIAAVRIRQYELAFADIFGTNLFDIALVFLADAVYLGPPILGEVGRFSLVAALIGIVLTVVYLVGLIERRDRVVLRMGLDSLLVLGLYAGGLVLLYQLR